MKEKLDPYLQPLYDALNDMIPPARLVKLMEEGAVQIAPLAYMRGRTLDNAFMMRRTCRSFSARTARAMAV